MNKLSRPIGTQSGFEHSARLLAAAGLVFVTQLATAQTWQTVDDFQYVAGQDANNTGLTVAPNGTLFACGWGADAATNSHALVMASTDGGTTWSAPLDDFSLPSVPTWGGHIPGPGYTAIASDLAGNLYGAGVIVAVTNGSAGWFVRRSADGGATWNTVDLQSVGPRDTAANAIAADNAGNVYAVGAIANNWVVRKGIGGTNFATVDNFFAGGSGLSGAQAVLVHPTAGIFVGGSAPIFTNVIKSGKTTSTLTYYGWVVRRSTDNGATWQTVDAFSFDSGYGTGNFYGASVFGLGADALGNIYAVGSADEVTSKAGGTRGPTIVSHWVVRKSTNAGASWTTVDSSLTEIGLGFNPVASGFAADSNGNLFVAGWDVFDWIVRENPVGNSAWQTVDDFKYLQGANALAITADSLGHVFVGGRAWTSSDHWLVRKH